MRIPVCTETIKWCVCSAMCTSVLQHRTLSSTLSIVFIAFSCVMIYELCLYIYCCCTMFPLSNEKYLEEVVWNTFFVSVSKWCWIISSMYHENVCSSLSCLFNNCLSVLYLSYISLRKHELHEYSVCDTRINLSVCYYSPFNEVFNEQRIQ